MDTQSAFSGQDLQDVGLYLQGLLQIMAADGHLHQAQRLTVHAYACDWGFNPRFVDEAIDSVLQNNYFPRIPPRFNSQTTAREFFRKAARIAVCDGLLHPNEQAWLVEAAVLNGLEPDTALDILDGVPISAQRPRD